MTHLRETIQEAQRMLAEGVPVKDVSKRLKVPKQTVSRWRENMGQVQKVDLEQVYQELLGTRPSSGIRFLPLTPASKEKIVQQEQYVYFIREELRGTIKIGKTGNVAGRLRDIRTHCPQEVSLIGYIKTPKAGRLESQLHKRFREKNVNREWFALSEADIQSLQEEYQHLWSGEDG